MKTTEVKIDCKNIPNVLLLGNGMLRLNNNGMGWDALINKISDHNVNEFYKQIPYAMQPEAVCGVEVENIQRKVAGTITDVREPDLLLNRILSLPFDAIVTTNYSYEIEKILSGKWSSYERRKSFVALDGNYRVNHNTYICNLVQVERGKNIPVFHIHGEYERKHSMILSYYSYANNLAKLVDYNKKLGNKLLEFQQEEGMMNCNCWLDYFLLGNVWSVGFGLDLSEFDVWWAIERKAREKAKHGVFKAYFDGNYDQNVSQCIMLEAMNATYTCIPVYNNDFASMYLDIIEDIKKDLQNHNGI